MILEKSIGNTIANEFQKSISIKKSVIT